MCDFCGGGGFLDQAHVSGQSGTEENILARKSCSGCYSLLKIILTNFKSIYQHDAQITSLLFRTNHGPRCLQMTYHSIADIKNRGDLLA